MYKCLDLFCGGGGASMGIHQAGFEVVGLDLNPQPEYPFEFIRGSALALSQGFLKSFDFIWASPPCQAFSVAAARWKSKKQYPDLVDPVRKMLLESGVPFIIENVAGAPIQKDLMLCGEMFGLKVIRHRYFELNKIRVKQPPHKKHRGSPKTGEYVTCAGHGGDGSNRREDWQKAMKIHWINNKKTLAQCIPPKYSRYIFENMEVLENV